MHNTAIISSNPQAIWQLLPGLPTTEPEQHDKHVRTWRWQAFERARLAHEIKFGRY